MPRPSAAPSTRAHGTVSVVVPVRNALAFLARTVPSVLEATRRSGAELIYVDNGSTDESRQYLANRAFRTESNKISASKHPTNK